MTIDDTVNKDTLDAIAEIQKLKENPNKKVYSDFSELLGEVEKDLKYDTYSN